MDYIYYRLDPKYLQPKYQLESTLQDFFYGYQTFLNPKKKYQIKNILPVINQKEDGYYYFWNKFFSIFAHKNENNSYSHKDIYIDHDVFLFDLPNSPSKTFYFYSYGIYRIYDKYSAACFSLKTIESFQKVFEQFFLSNRYIRKKPDRFEELLLTNWIKNISENQRKQIIFLENKISKSSKNFKNFILHYQTQFLYHFIIKNKDPIKSFLKEKFYIKNIKDLLKILKELDKIYKETQYGKARKSYFL